MRDGNPAPVTRLTDYRPPAWLVDHTRLDVDLRDGHATVTAELTIPTDRTPRELPLYSESLPPNPLRPVRRVTQAWDSRSTPRPFGHIQHWQETWTGEDGIFETEDGKAVLFGDRNNCYLAGWPDAECWDHILGYFRLQSDAEAVKDTSPTPQMYDPDAQPEVRLRRTAQHLFVMNYTNRSQDFRGHKINACDLAIFHGSKRIM